MPIQNHDIAARVNALTPDQLATLAGRLGVPVAERRRLVAFCQPKDRSTPPPDTRSLRSYLEDRLPGPQLPAEIHFLASLPQLPNGKTDFGALAAMRPQTPATPPTTPTPDHLSHAESTLLKIWAEILGSDAITTDDNFFELGGDSISSINLLAMAAKAGLDIPANAIFDHPTIAGLAKLATPKNPPPSPATHGQSPAASAPADPVQSGATFPTSSVQRALFLKNTTSPLGDPGVIQVQCNLSGQLDPDTFQNAWTLLSQRHESLRCFITVRDNHQPAIVIAPISTTPPTVHFDDLSSLAPAAQTEKIDAYIRADHSLGLDLTTPPVTRLAVFSTAKNAHLLIWTCHHALIDGWSASIVLDEFASAYHALFTGNPISLPPAPALATYYSWLTSRDEIAEEWFWRNQLQGLSPSAGRLPIGAPASTPLTPAFETGSVALSAEIIDSLRDAARSTQSTPYLLFLAAWALTLASYGDRRDVVFGTTFSGRSAGCEGTDKLVGLLANSLPFRVLIDSDDTVGEFLTRLQNTQKGLLDFQHVDLAKIHHRWSGLPLGSPLFESLVVFANFLGRPTATGNDKPIQTLSVENAGSGVSSTFPVTLTISPGTPWKLNLVYDSTKITRSTSSGLLAKMHATVKAIASSVALPIHHIIPPSSPLPDRQPPPTQTKPTPPADLDPIDARVVQIWNNAFGLDSILPDDDFVELGGHSLLGVVLLTEVECEFHCSLPPATILKCPTPRKLAAAVRLAVSSRSPSAPTPEAFIFIPGGFGDMLYYFELHRDDRGDLKVSGEIRAKKLRVDYSEHTPVTEVAARYASEIRRIQPTGPVYLASRFCAEFISLDVARLLAAAGEPPAFLGIIDHAPPSPPAVSSQTAKRFGRKWLNMIREHRLADLASYARRAPNVVFNGLSSRLKSSLSRSLATPPPGQQPRRFYYTEGFHNEYLARPFPGRVTLFLSAGFEQSDLGSVAVERWREQALGGVDVVRIPGSTHPDIFAPPTCSYLNASLNQLESLRRS